MPFPTSKTIIKAVPHARASDGVVLRWDLIARYSYSGEAGPDWEQEYEHSQEIEEEFQTRTASEYTKSELLTLMSSSLDHVFSAHYEVYNLPSAPAEELVDEEFDLDSLLD